MALRRVRALQQRGPGGAPEAVPNPPAATAGDQKGRGVYAHQDGKILQLCGEDPARPLPGRDGVEPGGVR